MEWSDWSDIWQFTTAVAPPEPESEEAEDAQSIFRTSVSVAVRA